MQLELTDEQAAALIRELDRIIADDRCEAPCGAFAERSASYPLSPRIMTLKAILGKLKPEAVREPLPPIKHYDPPRFIRGRRRRG